MITTKQLNNGIILNVEQIKGAKTISCFFGFKVGSLYEDESNYGISHLLEHLLFCGTTNRSNQKIKEDFNKYATIFNASTGVYNTRFYLKNVAEYFEYSFEIMSDMISNPLFSKTEFQKEKKVVFEEMLRYKDISNDELHKACLQSFYPDSNLKNQAIGKEESLIALTEEDVRQYYFNNYTTENCIISMAGDITFTKAKKLVEKYVKLKCGKPQINVLPFENPNHKIKSSVVEIQKDTNQSLIKIMFNAPNSKSNDYFKFIMLSNIIGGGTSSLLYKHLRDKLGLAYSVSVSTVNNYNSGLLIISMATKESNITTALNEIKNILKKLITKGIDENSLETEITKARIAYINASEQSITLAGSNNLDLIQTGEIIPNNTILETLTKITPNEIKELAKSLFKNQPSILGVLSKNKLNLKEFVIK